MATQIELLARGFLHPTLGSVARSLFAVVGLVGDMDLVAGNRDEGK